jgi:uncharacterized protein YndB with AHSA1/START domain
MSSSDAPAAPEAEREVVIVREMAVPARFLFRAWSRPEHLVAWFGPPGYPLTLCEVDFRVGGRYRFAMTSPAGVQMTPFGGEYLAIEPDRLIRYSNRFEEPGAETMIVTVTFEESAGRTKVTMHTLFGSIAMKRTHLERGYAQGVNAGLDQLAALVAGWSDA